MTKAVNILPLGACLIRGPLEAVHREGTRLTFSRYRPIGPCYTFGFILQAVAMLRGERDVPQEIRPLCGISARAGPISGADTFADVDMAILEPASPIEITYRDCTLNRLMLYNLVVAPIRALGPQASVAAMQWFRVGVEGLNAEVLAEAGRATVELLPADYPAREFTVSVLLETRSARSDILRGFRTVREVINRPIGVVGYVFHYLADGRAVSWPAGFLDEVRDAARELDLPILEPADHVNAYPAGVAAALKPDLRHYSEPFGVLMGNVLVEFCKRVSDGARHSDALTPHQHRPRRESPPGDSSASRIVANTNGV